MPTIIKRKNPSGNFSYQVKIRVKGYPPVTDTFSKKTDAERWAQRTEADIREDKYFPNNKAKKHTVSDLIGSYLKHIEGKNLNRYNAVKPLLDWWNSELGNIVLSHFKSEPIINGQQKLLSRQKQRKNSDGSVNTLSPSTINKYTIALHTAINYGIRPLRWITTNPVNDVDKLKEPTGRTRFLSDDEIKRLLNACRESKNQYLFALVIIAISTGARRAEIQYMRWMDVNEDATLVTLPKTKNGEVRSAHLTGVASEIIRKMRDNREDNQILLFPSPYNPNRPIDFESAWNVAREKAKIEDFRFHDLRHTCGSYLAMNGASLVEISEVLGHKTIQMSRRYAHLTKTHTNSVVGKMTERVLGNVKI